MPAFTVAAPDGRKFTVNAPEGATAQEALKHVQTRYTVHANGEELTFDGPDNATDEQLKAFADQTLRTQRPTIKFPPSQVKRLPPAPPKSILAQIADLPRQLDESDFGKTVRGLGGNFIDGLTGSWADELGGVGETLNNAWASSFGQEDFDPSASFDRGQAKHAANQEEVTQANPWSAYGARAAGIGTSFAFPEARIARGAGMGAKIANTAATAGLYSAAAGLGKGEGSERLGNAAFDGTAGTMLGAAIRPAMGAGSRLAHGVYDLAAPYVSRTAGNAAATRGANRRIAQGLEASGTSPVQAAQEVAARHAQGTPATVADVAEATRDPAAKWANRGPGPGQTAVRSAVERRQANSASRVINHLQDTLGSIVDPYRQSASLSARAMQDAAPLYRQAYDQPPMMTEELQSLLQTPAGREALSQAHRIAGNERMPAEATGIRFGLEGAEVPDIGLTPRGMDYVKRGLDDLVEGNRDALTGRLSLNTEGRSINDVRHAWLSEVDRINPLYAEARQAAAGPLQDRNAFERGLENLPGSRRSTAADAQASMATLSPSQLDQFRLGDRTRLANEVSAQPHYSDATTPLNRSDAHMDLIREVHGSEAADALQTRLAAEGDAYRTYRAVRGHSVSDDLSGLPEQPATITSAIAQLATGHPFQAAMTIGKSMDGGAGRLGAMTREEFTRRVLDPDLANATQTLDSVQRQMVEDARAALSLDRGASKAGKVGAIQLIGGSGDETGLYGPTEY